MVHTTVKSHYLVRQPGPARVSFAHGDGWVALPYYDIRECRLDDSQSDATLFVKHNEYTIILRGHNLRPLYWSLLLEEVAEISGASLLQTFRRVLLPLLAPVLIACWLYVFVLCVRELAASIFLAGATTHVLGTVSLTLWEGGGSLGAVCALGVVEVIPLVVIVAVMRRLETSIRAH